MHHLDARRVKRRKDPHGAAMPATIGSERILIGLLDMGCSNRRSLRELGQSQQRYRTMLVEYQVDAKPWSAQSA